MTVTRDFEGAGKRDIYRILTSLVIPRPIAWVTTLGSTGVVNLAPFSSFMGIFNPPSLAICFGSRRDGSLKDTHRNLVERGEGVVHIADSAMMEALNNSADEASPEVSEVERLGLATVSSDRVAPPRLAEAPVALECRFRRELSLGPSTYLVLLDVLMAHAEDRIWDEAEDRADGSLWEPLARLGSLGGPDYALLGKRFTLGKPHLS